MKKKIGVLTLPLSDNYGGIIQAIALCHYLTELDCEVELLRKETFNSFFKNVAIKILEKLPFQNIKNIRARAIGRSINNKFIEKNIASVSPLLYTDVQMEQYVTDGRHYGVVVGSDQVWRIDYIDDGYYSVYFLSFVNRLRTKKISYAASFGTKEWTRLEYKSSVSNYLSTFDAISVREKGGVDLCKAQFGCDHVEHVLDPTLLVDERFYGKFTHEIPSKSDGKKVLFFYCLDESGVKEGLLKATNYILGDGYKVMRATLSYSKDKRLTIPEWMARFRDSDFILTDSFHGMIFSIINKKQFIVCGNKSRGIDRFVSLLSQLGLAEYLVDDQEKLDVESVEILLKKRINYEDVGERLEKLRIKSQDFLKNSIK